MSKKSVELSAEAFEYAEKLVADGVFPDVASAVSAEMIGVKEQREELYAALSGEVLSRMETPREEWISCATAEEVMQPHFDRIKELRAKAKAAE